MDKLVNIEVVYSHHKNIIKEDRKYDRQRKIKKSI